MAYIKRLTPGAIARAECVLGEGLESATSVQRRTGADIVVNWPIFEFGSGRIDSRFVVFGKRYGDYASWGIAFGPQGPYWDYDGQGGAPCFAGAYTYLVRDGKIWDSLGDKRAKGRTAMGLTASGELVVYVAGEGSREACSTGELAQRMLSLGCVNAINGDGSLSSQVASPDGRITTTRRVPGFVCIWLQDKPSKGEEKMKSIYLSPSTQERNQGAGSYGTEESRMNEICDLVENELRGKYILYRNRPEMSLQQVVADSNAKAPHIHVAIHSNAGGGRGCEAWICAKGGQAERLANKIYGELAPLTPTSDRGVKVSTTLYEVNKTKAPAVIVEVEFHDSEAGAEWILRNKAAIARAIARGIMLHFGDTPPDALPGSGTEKWYAKELAEAVAAGITDGDRPDDPATRAEVAVMVLRGLKR